METDWDVIVVGGGPGGALAARKCAAAGLSTLLIEQRRMPRDKCCTGMVMAPWGQQLMRREFGTYPEWVERETIHLRGYALHVPGARPLLLDIPTPTTWRHTLDTWMCRSAEAAGARLRDQARLVRLDAQTDPCTLELRIDDAPGTLRSRFVIGCDGAHSLVRRSLFPDFHPPMMVGYRVAFDTRLELAEDRFHMFARSLTDLFFVHRKGGQLLLEGVAPEGQLDATIEGSRQHLVEHCGLDPRLQPVWRDGCPQPAASIGLATGSFRPAVGNLLLVGDAAGANVPITGEGLAMALLTGLHAGEEVVEAHRLGQPAETGYQRRIDRILDVFSRLAKLGPGVRDAQLGSDRDAFAGVMLAAWDRALNVF